jgi:phosphoadenosine phosphosulfate reductase
MFTQAEIERLSREFETRTPQDIIAWAIDSFWPEAALSSSFQTHSMVLLHMATRIRRDLPVYFLDTGYHFWETLTFREQVAHQWMLNVVDLYRDSRWDVFVRQNMRTLPLEDPNLCCYLHKVLPMQQAMRQTKAWISGIRRDQTPERAKAAVLELQKDGLLKVHPLLNWTRRDVQAYLREHSLPTHPLFEKGYRSVGCAPCTLPVGLDEDERAGRWAGRNKTECGLHTPMFEQGLPDLQSRFSLQPIPDPHSRPPSHEQDES